MAKCAICEKGAHFGNNVSHSHRKTPKMWKSNVKSVRVKTEYRFFIFLFNNSKKADIRQAETK